MPKTNHKTASLRIGKLPNAEKVRDVKPAAKGTATRVAQSNPDGNPKKRKS